MPFKLPSFNDLNQTQKILIQLLPKADKLAVIGGPGTGKTIVGVEGAIQMMNLGKKCLFLSYSRTLKYFIENIASDNNLDMSKIEIDTFHHWFWYFMINEFKMDKQQLAIYQEQDFVWNVGRLNNFFNTCGKTTEQLIKYDCLFIDEAQDIQDGMMKILKRITRNVFVTYDDSQKVGFETKTIDALEFDHSNILNDLGIGDRFYDLIDNYRNTKEIESVAKDFLSSYDENEMSLVKSTAKRTGPTPKMIKSADGNLTKVATYIANHFDKSKSVGVLFGNDDVDRGKVVFSQLYEGLKNRLGSSVHYKYGKTDINNRNALSNGVFLMTMKSSKGLEFDQVYIIADNFSLEKIVGRNSLYVSITRARESVNIVTLPTTTRNKELNEVLESKSYMFKEERI